MVKNIFSTTVTSARAGDVFKSSDATSTAAHRGSARRPACTVTAARCGDGHTHGKYDVDSATRSTRPCDVSSSRALASPVHPCAITQVLMDDCVE